MKHLILLSALFLSLNSFAGLQVTGQLTSSTDTSAYKIGDNTSYFRLTYIFNADGNSIDVLMDGYKNKASYTNKKKTLEQSAQVNRVYTINSDTLASAPITNFNALNGKSLLDKLDYWIHQRVMNQILFTNPTFVVSIVDIKL